MATYRFNKETGQVECVSRDIKAMTHDVYFREPYFDEHLGDEKSPDGYYIHSKAHKKSIMERQGVHEKGDMVHGSRNFDPVRFRMAKERGML